MSHSNALHWRVKLEKKGMILLEIFHHKISLFCMISASFVYQRNSRLYTIVGSVKNN